MCDPTHCQFHNKKSARHWKFVWISWLLLVPFHCVRWFFVGTLPTFMVQQKPGNYDETLARIEEESNYGGEDESCFSAVLERENAFATNVLPKAWDLNYFQAKFDV